MADLSNDSKVVHFFSSYYDRYSMDTVYEYHKTRKVILETNTMVLYKTIFGFKRWAVKNRHHVVEKL